MLRRVFTSVLLALSLIAIPATAQASTKLGPTCSKLGTTAVSSGIHYHCGVSGKKLVWVKNSSPKGPVSKKTIQTPTANLKLKQSIAVPFVNTVDISTGKFPGVFLSDSKLVVELSTSTPLICSPKDQSIYLLQTGKCRITASQPGNEKYLPAQPVTFSLEVTAPTITSDNALFDDVQTFIRVPLGTKYASDTAEITLTAFVNDASGEVCTNDPTASGCLLSNGAGVADPTSQTRYVEFKFHLKNLDANPLPSVSYRLLVGGLLSDIDTSVVLDTLSNVDLETDQSIDGSFFGLVPKNLNLTNGYLIIDEGITDSSVKLLMALSN